MKRIEPSRSTRPRGLRTAARGGVPPLVGAVLLAASLLASPPARAERVVMRDLRVLEVERVEDQGENLLLHLGAGGTAVVPRSQVREIKPSRERRTPPPAAKDAEARDWRESAGRFGQLIAEAARRHALDPELLLAVAMTESGLDPLAVSPKGAMGLMQLMPATADELAVEDPHDPEQNIDAGAVWLARMIERFGGDLDLALAAYNAGEGAVRRFGGIPPYAETRRYVREVRERLARFKGGSLGA